VVHLDVDVLADALGARRAPGFELALAERLLVERLQEPLAGALGALHVAAGEDEGDVLACGEPVGLGPGEGAVDGCVWGDSVAQLYEQTAAYAKTYAPTPPRVSDKKRMSGWGTYPFAPVTMTTGLGFPMGSYSYRWTQTRETLDESEKLGSERGFG